MVTVEFALQLMSSEKRSVRAVSTQDLQFSYVTCAAQALKSTIFGVYRLPHSFHLLSPVLIAVT